MSDTSEKEKDGPRRIVKKKGGHAAHHGGAWKVAYADFVTAMMALFIVLWIVGQSKSTKEAVSGYFKDPTNFSKGGSPGGLQSKGGPALLSQGGHSAPGSSQELEDLKRQKPPENDPLDRAHLDEAADQFKEAIQRIPALRDLQDQIRVEITNEGLRVQLIEGSRDSFFDLGSSRLKSVTRELLAAIAKSVSKLPNKVVLEGHTDARPYGNTGKPDYSNWELSTDRANSARRAIVEAGLHPDQVARVTGFADQDLLNPKDPLDTANRRISILVRFLTPPTDATSLPLKPEGNQSSKR